MTWRLHRLTLIIRVSDSWSAATEAPSTEARGSVSQTEQIRLKLKTKLSKHRFILKYFDKWLKITSSRDTNQKYPLWKGDAFKVLMVCHFSIYRGSGEKSVRGKKKIQMRAIYAISKNTAWRIWQFEIEFQIWEILRTLSFWASLNCHALMGPTQVVQTHWSQLNLFDKEILEKIPSEMEVALHI